MDSPASSSVSDVRRSLVRLVRERGYERREEPFVLSSGGTSRDYVDLRRAVARGEDLALVARAAVEALSEEAIAYDAIGGMTMGADPLAHAVALSTTSAWFSVRKAEKSHGAGRRIEGAEIGPATRVVVVEDTVSTGRSLLESVDVVEETGAPVRGVLVVLDRTDTLAGLLATRLPGVPFVSLLTYRDLGIDPV